jgi:diketogulonate reductase-like aldo/keto reductase
MKTVDRTRIKTVKLPSGERVPAFGMGTWRMAEDAAMRAEEIATLRLGIDLGATLIDTAEMYADGAAEELVGKAIEGRRDEVFLVTKVLPQNASRRGTPVACERSLRRLGTDRIDLYLLHWRGSVPLAETLEAFLALQAAGKIRYYGVSNLDRADLEELWAVPGADIATDQVLYNLGRRGIEWDLLPWLRERHVPVMAYSPVEQSRLATDARLARFARDYGMTAAQAAIAWLLVNPGLIVIPKTSRRSRLKENLGALEHRLTKVQLAEVDHLFPPPTGPRALELL